MGYKNYEAGHAAYIRWKTKLGPDGWKEYFSDPDRMARRRANGIRRRKKLGENFPKYQRNANLKAKYGITEDGYSDMYITQDGRCKICCMSFEKLCVDHNHATGAARDLLCHRCNRGLAFVEDSDFRARCLKYLDEHA